MGLEKQLQWLRVLLLPLLTRTVPSPLRETSVTRLPQSGLCHTHAHRSVQPLKNGSRHTRTNWSADPEATAGIGMIADNITSTDSRISMGLTAMNIPARRTSHVLCSG